jgi:hypothetical protein
MSAVAVFLVFAAAVAVCGIPGYVIAARSGVSSPAVAFVPFLGLWIALFESMRRSGWLALLVLVPTVGAVAVLVWTAAELPRGHGRSQWWTLPLVIPGLNLVGYWIYAFTLPKPAAPTLRSSPA